MTDDERRAFPDDTTPFSTDGKYHFEPDVFHSLHCLNSIRVHLHPVLYNVSSTQDAHSKTEEQIMKLVNDPMWKRNHLEHCLDRVRQALMCHGDLTPSPTYTWPGFPISIGRSGTHTCRKWGPIREWMDQRAANGESLQHEHGHGHGDSA
ncbi:hypothetical protein ACJQWK_03994 [Exserohilum turcicum]